MKYNELHRLLRKAGCIEVGQMSGHRRWLNPKTGEHFATSNHLSAEVAAGTLRKILKMAGIKN